MILNFLQWVKCNLSMTYSPFYPDTLDHHNVDGYARALSWGDR